MEEIQKQSEGISIIVPAYNEEKRISEFLSELQNFCEQNQEITSDYEILIVNDGSKDKTLDLINSMKTAKTQIISYEDNQGKGHAVKKGILTAKFDKVIFMDADGAIAPTELPRMISKLAEHDCVVGSRNLPKSQAKKDWFRKILSFGFNNYVSLLFWMNHSDYLCGFKGFNINKTKKVWENMQDKKWIFDVELFYRLKLAKIKVNELPIKWEHKDESKMTLFAIIKIFFGILKLRFTFL